MSGLKGTYQQTNYWMIIFKKNQQNIFGKKRADAKVAILTDLSIEKDITKEIKDAKTGMLSIKILRKTE